MDKVEAELIGIVVDEPGHESCDRLLGNRAPVGSKPTIKPTGDCSRIVDVLAVRPEQKRHEREFVVLRHLRPGERELALRHSLLPAEVLQLLHSAALRRHTAEAHGAVTAKQHDLELKRRQLGGPDDPRSGRAHDPSRRRTCATRTSRKPVCGTALRVPTSALSTRAESATEAVTSAGPTTSSPSVGEIRPTSVGSSDWPRAAAAT